LSKKSKPLSILVYSPYCLLRPTTNRIFDVRLCDAFSENGEEVTIVYPYTYMKDNIRRKDIPGYYNTQSPVKTRMLLTPLGEHSHKLLRFIFLMAGFTFSTVVSGIRNLSERKQLVFISRDAKSLLPPLFIRKILGKLCDWKVFFMAAEVKQSAIFKYVIRESDGILAGVSTTRDAIRKINPVEEDRFLLSLAPVPVYKNDPGKSEARRFISYDSSHPLVVYTGKLGLEIRELIYLLEAAGELPDYKFILTGGRQRVVDQVRNYCREKGINNVILTGFFEDSRKIRNYQLAADVLVSYYTEKDHMVEFNYPQKINEYMTTGNPVVTPDFPATRDVLNANNVLFVQPDNVASLTEGIRKLVEDKDLGSKLASQALKDVGKLTFSSKAAEFIAFIRKRTDPLN